MGKSTLVNRIVGRREAIVEERPGVTRDRKVLEAEWAGRRFSVVDTGGWLAAGSVPERRGGEETLDASVSRQAERAIAAADVVLFVLDVSVGVTEDDDRVAAVLRRVLRAGERAPKVLVAANKVDSESRESDAWDLGRLGLGEPLVVSALH